MQKNIKLSDISIKVVRKNIKNTHLSVYPPNGRVILVTPKKTRFEVARAYAVSKLNWIRSQQVKLREQAREFPHKFIDRESHQLWGQRYLMKVNYRNSKPSVVLSNKNIILTVPHGYNLIKRAKVIHNWHKTLLHTFVTLLIEKWERKLNLKVSKYFLQKMKTTNKLLLFLLVIFSVSAYANWVGRWESKGNDVVIGLSSEPNNPQLGKNSLAPNPNAGIILSES